MTPNTPQHKKETSVRGPKPPHATPPPKWCIATLGGCWIAGVSLLALNALSADDGDSLGASNNSSYLCGEEPAQSKTISVFPISTKSAPPAPSPELGKTTYGTYCIACHQPEGAGKVGFAPAIRNADFLALASDDFLKTTIKKGRAGTAMTPWAMLNDQQINGIIAYLRTTEGRTQIKVKVDDSRTFNGNATAGEPLYNTYCASCHGDKGIGYLAGSSGPGIGLKGFLDTASDDFIYQTMKYGRMGTPMKPMLGAVGLANLNDTEAADIIAYLRSLQGDKKTKEQPEKKVTGNVKIGEEQFNMNCMACHQPGGTGKPGFAPSIRNRDFLAIASDDFIRKTISKGRLGTAMAPRPDLSKENVTHIIAYLRALPNPNPITIKVDDSLKIRGDATAGSTKFTTYCAACHGEKGIGYAAGVAGPAIGMAGFLDVASDDYIFQTVKHGRAGTAMKPVMGPIGVANLTKDDVADIISYLRSLNKK